LKDTFLVPGKPQYLGATIMFNAQCYDAWGNLSSAMKSNKPTREPEEFLGDDEEATRTFVMGMHQRAMGVARMLVNMVELSTQKKMLDIGGGPATYSRLLLEKFPDLHSTVMDLPGVLNVAKEISADSPALSRLSFLEGNLFTDDFGTGFDTVLISGVLHRTEGEQTLDILKKIASCLEPGGKLMVSDLFTKADTKGPVLPELFSLHMMLTADSGQSLPMPQFKQQLETAGFKVLDTVHYPAPLPHCLIIAEKS
ncbi:MAG: methyltransferase, partial [Lentisphaeria bacterium]|nr:methyltransferase [Lentisphaeria bacterium]